RASSAGPPRKTARRDGATGCRGRGPRMSSMPQCAGGRRQAAAKNEEGGPDSPKRDRFYGSSSRNRGGATSSRERSFDGVPTQKTMSLMVGEVDRLFRAKLDLFVWLVDAHRNYDFVSRPLPPPTQRLRAGYRRLFEELNLDDVDYFECEVAYEPRSMAVSPNG